MTETKEINYDIICIGLGITGLYIGYRLRESKKNILFLEMGDVIGGRIRSIKVSKNVGYYGDGCAARYFPKDQPLIAKVIKELDIKSYPFPTNNIATPTDYKDISQSLLKKYPQPDPTLSFRQAIVNTTNKKSDVNRFANTLGYPLFKYNLNMDMAYNTLFRVASDTQYLPEGGFINVAQQLYEKIKSHYTFSFNTKVKKISKEKNGYLINGKYFSQIVVFTGTIDQLKNIDAPFTKDSIALWNKYRLPYLGIRMYVYISNPWWKKGDLFVKFTNFNPFNQIWYHTKNVIGIYSDMEDAYDLWDLIPPRIKGDFWSLVSGEDQGEMKWQKAKEFGSLYEKVLSLFPKGTKVESITYKFTPIAAQFLKPMNEKLYASFYKKTCYLDSFYLLGGDYALNYDPGWVNSAFQSVEDVMEKLK